MQTPKRPFNNRNLFSNHYLENQIKDAPEWGRSDHEAAFGKIKKIYQRESAFVGNLSESQLEDRLFRSLFAVILPSYEVQGATKSREFPDYAFFPDREARDRAQAKKDSESFFLEAFAVGEVKRWDAELDRFGKDRQDKRRNPSFQIWLYLHETEPAWGILSNGAKWRLYRQERPLDVYYEVDLAAMLAEGDLDAFKYFYYFFREEAFLPNEKGEVFLDEVLKGSANYAREIGENLKENVYRAMKKVAEGFIAWRENDLDPKDPETRARVQKNTMILLYRFLFLLYAEGKELLDLRDEVYASSYSFDRIKKEVATRLDGPAAQGFLPIKRSLWSDLSDLFRLIDQGSRNLGIDGVISVPAYNGGLFDPEKHPDLAKWTIGDSYLAEAIDLLSRSEAANGAGKKSGRGRGRGEGDENGANGGKGFVDYSTLEIRHLGSIYEGLLEYNLAVADEDLVVSGGKDRSWVPWEEFNRSKKKEKSFEEFGEFDRVRAGELYLTTDRGERKATGSYYTPDYIVDYIVEKTVGPVVEERWKEALSKNESLIDATRSVKVLDPAMGSGHFLVGAVEFLAGKLMRAAESDIEWGWVEDRGQFTPEWAKREAVSHSIYGVDLNELAVELAKVSLWLVTIAKDKPLSFLDHRLKQGNSLVGARFSDLISYPGERASAVARDQVTLPSFVSPRFLQHLIGKIKELEEIGDDSLSEIKRKEEVFEEFRNLPEYTKARAIANVHTAVYFGNEVEARATPQGTKPPDQVYHDLFWAVGGEEAEWRRKTSPAWFGEAQRIAGERSFFHWQLEFPEVFFEGGAVKGDPGWDAVVGNPPYVRQETLGEFKGYFEEKYRVYHGVADLYVYFVEQGVSLVQKDGFFSYILPNKWMRANYGSSLRSWMKERCIDEIVDFGDLPVFPEATTYPCILRLCGGPAKPSFKAAEVESLDFGRLKDYVEEKAYSVSLSGLDDSGWSLVDESVQSLLEKLRRAGTPLGEYVNGKIYYGIKTGLNEAFVIDEETRARLIREDPKSAELIKPFLAGRDIKRYEPPETDDYLIFTRRGVKIEDYPAIERHLEQFKDRLMPKPKDWTVGEWKGRKPGSYQWYEVQDSIDYYLEFKKPKIIVPAIVQSASYGYDIRGLYSNDKTSIIPTDDLYLLSILNSNVADYVIFFISSTKRGGYFEYKPMYVQQIPIRRISFSTPEDERRRLAEELKRLCAARMFEIVLEVVGDCLPKDDLGEFDAEGERSDVVHDLLAHLAEEMIQMNKEKQEEIRGFLAWLAEFCGARIEDLSNKTKVMAYYEIEFGELLSILKKNKRKLACDPGRRAFSEDLRREYSASMEKLSPLLLRIGEVDRLIDAVVYRLYGLTEAEVEIVEGSLS
jgi:type I restriction-modification system DNA methylase subunit